MNKSREAIKFYSVVLIIFLIMAGLSYLTPICIDDLWLEPVTSRNPIERWGVALDLYINHTGRMISQELWLFVLAYDKWVYAVLNALVYTLFVLLIYQYVLIVSDGEKYDSSFLLGIYVFLWFFTPTFGGIYLWRSASCTYLWTIIFALAIGKYYFADVFGNKERKAANKSNIAKCIGMFIFGILGGWSHEEISATLCMGILAYIVYHKLKRERIRSNMLWGIIGIFIGAAFLILDPANFTRAGTVVESSSFVIKYFYRIARETFYFLRFLSIPLGISCVLLYALASKDKISNVKQTIKNNSAELFLMILSVASVYIMTFSAGFALRIFITPIALSAMILGIELKKIQCIDLIKHRAIKYAIFVFALACAVEMVLAVYTANVTGELIYRDTIYNSSEEGNIFNQ